MSRLPNLFLVFLSVALLLAASAFPAAAQSPTPPPHNPATAHTDNPAAADAQLYRNPTFGFRYKIPYGWVDRTREMNTQETNAQPKAATGDASDNANSNPRNHELEQKSQKSPTAAGPASEGEPSSPGQVLLAIFERPPDAVGDTINSAVVILAESVSAYPGLKKAEDYLGPLTELATAKGFKPSRDPEDITIDSRPLIRADFAKPLGPAKDPAKEDTDALTMHQSTLVLLSRSQIVSFTFIAGSEDEIDDLIEALHFGPTTRR